MKNILVLFGSPKNNGFTALILKEFLSNLKDYNVTIIDSYKENIHPCIDCGVCKEKESCSYSDFDKIDHLLRTTDLLIVATPVYNLSFPSPLKAIFDRTQRYFSARFCLGVRPPIQKEKKAILLLTCGSNDKRGQDIVKTQLEMMFTIINAKLVDTIVWNNTDKFTSIDKLIPTIQKVAKLL